MFVMAIYGAQYVCQGHIWCLVCNQCHCGLYSIQHCVIKFVSDIRHVCNFLRILWFHSPIKPIDTIQLNIVKSGVIHNYPDYFKSLIFCHMFLYQRHIVYLACLYQCLVSFPVSLYYTFCTTLEHIVDIAHLYYYLEQVLLTIPEHLIFPGLQGVCVDRSLVFYVVFCRSLFVLLSFFF